MIKLKGKKSIRKKGKEYKRTQIEERGLRCRICVEGKGED
jgi:hypothetical protein